MKKKLTFGEALWELISDWAARIAMVALRAGFLWYAYKMLVPLFWPAYRVQVLTYEQAFAVAIVLSLIKYVVRGRVLNPNDYEIVTKQESK